MVEVSGPGKGADRGAWAAARDALGDPDLSSDRLLANLLELADGSKAARRGVATALVGHAVVDTLAELAGVDPSPGVKGVERLLRKAAGREGEARRRSNPIRRNEGFVCDHCGHDVRPAVGGGIRNHCPRCLRSKHVDGDVPGDREARCEGVMDPVSWSTAGGVSAVLQRCRRCGHERPNRLRFDGPDDPDRDDVLRALGGERALPR